MGHLPEAFREAHGPVMESFTSLSALILSRHSTMDCFSLGDSFRTGFICFILQSMKAAMSPRQVSYGLPAREKSRHFCAKTTMLILVPVKRVIDPFAKVKPLPDGSAIDTSAVKFEINPFDEIALEEAVRIKER